MGAAKEKLKEAGNPFGQGIELGIYRERAPCHSHIAYFWECDADFAKAVGFLAVGLNGTDHCILLGHPEANEKVCAILTGEGHDVAALRSQGRLALISGAPNGEALRKTLQKTFQRALGQGAPLVRLLTNLGWNQEGWPSDLDLCALEAHLTEIATQFPCLVLCMYAAGSLPGFILHQAGLQTHPLVQHGSECGRNPFFTPTGQYLRQLPSIAEQITNSQLREETEWEVQKRFIALNEKAHICVFYTDSDGATVHVSRCWAELLGMAQPRATREAWMQTIHEEDRAPVLESWRESVENKAPFSFELRFLRADGHLLWASAHAIPDKDPQGNLL
ncbi:MAG: MEDS domain-containing protein, partial [Verrucomicrobiota bacterium]